jgi:hypothetical protein
MVLHLHNIEELANKMEKQLHAYAYVQNMVYIVRPFRIEIATFPMTLEMCAKDPLSINSARMHISVGQKCLIQRIASSLFAFDFVRKKTFCSESC